MNEPNPTIVRGRRVLTPSGLGPAEIHVANGRIVSVEPPAPQVPESRDVYDAGDALVLPGFVDTHVHVNEPGRTEWEGFATATDAAAAGGVTTFVDMPLNCSPVTCTVPALEAKREAANGKLRVDVGFWGGVVPGNTAELTGLAAAGVLGFKCFLVDSGLDEFPPVGEAELRPAMREIARLGLPLLVHAEAPGPIAAAAAHGRPGASASYPDWLASRPPEAEVEALRLLVRLVDETGCAVHVVHVSAHQCLPIIAAAKDAGLPVTAETCPHYLTFAAKEIPAGYTLFKCAPPIRGAENRERLWEGLEVGTLDLVASDHSPCPPARRALDSGDFFAAWGGIASLQLGPRAVWTEARRRGIVPDRLVEWMAEAPARLAGLEGRKGRIAAGFDADLVVLDPDAEFVVEPGGLCDRHCQTPYEGRLLRGEVRRTWVGGRLVFADGELTGERRGRVLERPAAEEMRRARDVLEP
ncbi:MAG TPA: allantoinase AllB [Gemmatimonadota bacterium]|nr:allantoinase AllB [Gemmatimonadota bacterium]